MAEQPLLRLQGLVKKFGEFTAVDNVDLEIEEGEFFTIVGPSGSGKSTLIRLLVGMDDVTEGQILLGGERIDLTPANLRPTCMVFQSLALFPHMSVGQNIEFPLKIRNENASQRKRALELLDLLRLPRSYYQKRISQCSGGEKQRVALARALAFDPEILFFDEPLSALDYRLRKTLEKELKDLHARTGKTFVYITHSLEEAMVMSDRIAIMKEGRFEQVAKADKIYAQPVSRFVAEFMGEVNLFEIKVKDNGAFESDALTIDKKINIPAAEGFKTGLLMVRPEYMHSIKGKETYHFKVSGKLHGEYALGSRIQYEFETAAGMVTVEKLREDRLSANLGELIELGFNLDITHFIGEVK
jgi:spermidine/putrescine transport system ATP-binding protein